MNQNINNNGNNNNVRKGNFPKNKKRPNWRTGGYKKRKEEVEAKFICPICEEGVKELGNAMDFKGQGPAHFDCVLRYLNESEKLSPGEKIVYIGSGKFGVILNKKNDSGVPFTITREIEFEDREREVPWRDERKISVSVND